MKGSMLYLNFQSDPENIYIYISLDLLQKRGKRIF